MPKSLFRSALARELTAVIAVKIVLIALATVFLFGPQQRPHIDSIAMFSHLFKS